MIRRCGFDLRSLLWLACVVAVAGTQASAQPHQGSSEVPASAVTTRDLIETRGLSGLAVAPDATHAVVRVDRQDVDANRTILEWRVVNLRSGQSRMIADGGAPRWTNNGYIAMETPQWSPDSRWIYIQRLVGEEVQLWRAARDGQSLQQISRDPSDIVGFIIDGSGGIHYAVGPATREAIKAAEQAEYDNGVLLDASVIMGYPVTYGFPVNGRMATYRLSSGSDNPGRSTLLGNGPLRAFSLDRDLASVSASSDVIARQLEDLRAETAGGLRPFDPGKTHRAYHAPLQRSATLTRVERGAEKAAPTHSGTILAWQAEGQGGGKCLDPICAEADFLSIVGWSPDGRELIFQTRTFGVVGINAWDVRSDTVRGIARTEGVLGSHDSGTVGQCQLAGNVAVCISAAADIPPKLVSIDLRTGQARVLLDPNPHLVAGRLGVARRVTLTDRFGSVTLGRLILPRESLRPGRLPLVITSYNCDGFLLGGSGRDVPEHVLAGLGLAALCVDHSANAVRRAADFVFTPTRSQQSGLDFFESAVSVLDSAGLIDPQRVMIAGFSGSATNTAFAISQSRRFAAAIVTTQGSLDAIACYLTAHYRSCRDWATLEQQAPPYDSRDGILANSPAWNAERIATPLLMQLPETEYEGMMQLYGAMRDYGRAVEMYIFADAYHYKHQPRQRLAVYDRSVDWALFWLTGLPSVGKDAALQNDRWDELRDQQCRLFVGERALADPPWYCAN